MALCAVSCNLLNAAIIILYCDEISVSCSVYENKGVVFINENGPWDAPDFHINPISVAVIQHNPLIKHYS